MSKVLSFCVFANDTNIFYSSRDLITVQKVMNIERKKVKNIDKTNSVFFHSPHKKLLNRLLLNL